MVKAALLIGISDYQNDLQPLAGATRDVEALAAVLQDLQVGEFDQVGQLLNADRQQIEVAIYEFFANRSPDDLLLFYFSGHGILDASGRLYLATPATIRGAEGLVTPTAVSTGYLQERMGVSYSKRMVLILDCCHSGAVDPGLGGRKDGDGINIQQQLGGRGRAILTSSDTLEYSYEQKEGSLSVYTYYLVEGIRTGAADEDGNGWITVEELHRYTKRKVQEDSPAMTPQFFRDQDANQINLVKASSQDPRLKYRKAVDAIAWENEGDLDDPIDRVFLDERCNQLGLEREVARQIEAEVVQPWQERWRKLGVYGRALQAALQRHDPLTDRQRKKLKRLQDELKLRDEDLQSINPRSTQVITPATPIPEPSDPLQEFNFQIATIEIQSPGSVTLKRKQGTARSFVDPLSDSVGLEMVYIPGGSFLMGSPETEEDRYGDESPQHEVTIQPFYMAKYPVTQAQWRIVAGWDPVERDLDPDPSGFKGDDRPVERVSWWEAVEFCARISQRLDRFYRLPSEAEWEYACRAGTTTPFHFGETITTDLANYCGKDREEQGWKGSYGSGPKGIFREETTPVGSFGVTNAFGLYDMHGNVWEWCADLWHENYENAPKDGMIWEEGDNKESRLLRGGSWFDDPVYCRSANRDPYPPGHSFTVVGFRFVLGSAPR